MAAHQLAKSPPRQDVVRAAGETVVVLCGHAIVECRVLGEVRLQLAPCERMSGPGGHDWPNYIMPAGRGYVWPYASFSETARSNLRDHPLHTITCCTTSPCTSVRRKCRPWNL